MVAYYLDTSALLKRYITEDGSQWVRGIFRSPDHILITSRITQVEAASAFARRVREGTLTILRQDQALSLLYYHIQNRF